MISTRSFKTQGRRYIQIKPHCTTLMFHFSYTWKKKVFTLYDWGVSFQMLKLDEQQFLGEATCALSEVSTPELNLLLFVLVLGFAIFTHQLTMQIITKSNRTVALELMRKESVAATAQPQNYGKLVVHAEESLASKTTTEIVLRCLHLEPMDHFSKSVRADKYSFTRILLET